MVNTNNSTTSNQSSTIEIFNYNSKEIRIITIKGEPWFVAIDLCNLLGISDPSSALRRLDDDEKLTRTLYWSGQNRQMTIISESGMYSLVLTSRKEEAKKFKKWITSEVLPSIRKTGKYSIPELDTTDGQEVLDASDKDLANFTEKYDTLATRYESEGRHKLAQAMRGALGNILIKYQQKLLYGANTEIGQCEGAVDVAIRLGYVVPPNLESTLGKAVQKDCPDLVKDFRNKRYSLKTGKNIRVLMYPEYNRRVEIAVANYCEKKGMEQLVSTYYEITTWDR